MTNRATISGLETYYGPIPTAFEVNSKYNKKFYISPSWVVSFSNYHRDNLLQALSLIFEGYPVLNALNTGDWLWWIMSSLAKPKLEGTRVVSSFIIDEEDHPNVTKHGIVEEMVTSLAGRIMVVDGISLEEAKDKARRYLDAER